MSEALSANHSPLSLYIHLPWCLHKCAYCDFNSHATDANAFPEQDYVNALINDLKQSSEAIKQRQVQSIFIGGGTPSLFSATSIENILIACHDHTQLNSQCEITIETNPGTFEYQKFADFLTTGVNRISIGVQSLNNKHLKALERIHTREEAIIAVETAHKIGFKNINADLMFGLPEQIVLEALQDIQTLCELPLTHISYYQLTLEPNTVFHRFPPSLPNEDTLWEIQNNGLNMLCDYGYERYEVSAYAQNNLHCLHNVNYWQYGDYLGIGAGAHSKLTTEKSIIRHQRTRQPDSYMKAVSNNTHVLKEHAVDEHSCIFEFMLNNLRLTQGFTVQSFSQFTGLSWATVEEKIQAYTQEGLLEQTDDHIRASALGYRYLDELTQRFLPEVGPEVRPK